LVFGSIFVAMFAGMDPAALEDPAQIEAVIANTEPGLLAGIGFGAIAFYIFFLGFATYLSVAAQVKRLHDMNVSGLWILANYVSIPVAMSIAMMDEAFAPLAFGLGLVPLGFFIACLFFPGTAGPNAFGEDRLSIFDISASAEEGDWQDRVKAHRSNLRDVQVEKNEAKAAAKEPRSRRSGPVKTNKGFGKRGMA